MVLFTGKKFKDSRSQHAKNIREFYSGIDYFVKNQAPNLFVRINKVVKRRRGGLQYSVNLLSSLLGSFTCFKFKINFGTLVHFLFHGAAQLLCKQRNQLPAKAGALCDAAFANTIVAHF